VACCCLSPVPSRHRRVRARVKRTAVSFVLSVFLRARCVASCVRDVRMTTQSRMGLGEHLSVPAEGRSTATAVVNHGRSLPQSGCEENEKP